MDINLIEIQETYNEYLMRLPNACDVIINQIQSEKKADAINTIIQFVEGVTWLIEIQYKLKELGIHNNDFFSEINEFMEEINAGLEKEDFVLVSDIFEYEIKPFFGSCKGYSIKN